MADILLEKARDFVQKSTSGRGIIKSDVGSLTLVLIQIDDLKVLGFHMISIKKRHQGRGIGSEIIKESMKWVDSGFIAGRASLNVMSPIADNILKKYPIEKINRFGDIQLDYPSYIYTRSKIVLENLK
jgi:GNAT superfamily N-acetyltransferase